MFSTLKRRVKKIMKKVEEVIETKELVKNKIVDSIIDGCKKLYLDLSKNKKQSRHRCQLISQCCI